MTRNTRFVGIGLGLAFALLGGCNSVLGIEEARSRSTVSDGSMSPAPGADRAKTPVSNCNTKQDCTDCLEEECPLADIKQCLSSGTCRTALDGYRSCLGQDCAETTDICMEELFEADDPSTPICFTACSERCLTSPLVTPCQLYCSCMNGNCNDKFASEAECLLACADETATTVGCRSAHCDFAEHSKFKNHCEHAMGDLGFCESTAEIKVTCKDKNIAGWTCARNEDCCSNRCDSMTETCL